ncbi:MAG: 4Fe-4S binding protein [Deltaproteobacteria bacterium]|nr:4Fe-4S binding protein [Deltaproteobacteria bacterium]
MVPFSSEASLFSLPLALFLSLTGSFFSHKLFASKSKFLSNSYQISKTYVEACAERAVFLPEGQSGPAVDFEHCLSCGQCLKVCPTGDPGGRREGLSGSFGRKTGTASPTGPGIGRHPFGGGPADRSGPGSGPLPEVQ